MGIEDAVSYSINPTEKGIPMLRSLSFWPSNNKVLNVSDSLLHTITIYMRRPGIDISNSLIGMIRLAIQN